MSIIIIPACTQTMYEAKQHALATRSLFVRRIALHAAAAAALILLSLAIGMSGYMAFEHLDRIDAFLNASMLLGGMGPVDLPRTEAGKVFAGLYALYAGLVFLVTVGLVFAPLIHRIMHRFHLENDK